MTDETTITTFGDPRLEEGDNLTGENRPKRPYVPSPAFRSAMQMALFLGKPLLLTGEPGCGKSEAAFFTARRLDLETPLRFIARTSSVASDLFYRYDALHRFADAQAGKSGEVQDVAHYITFEALGLAVLRALPPDTVIARGARTTIAALHDRRPGKWVEVFYRAGDLPKAEKTTAGKTAGEYEPDASVSVLRDPHTLPSDTAVIPVACAYDLLPEEYRVEEPTRSLVLIDEVDKAPRDLANDVLVELDELRFVVRETAWQIPPKDPNEPDKVVEIPPHLRPIVLLTSNQEKDLPDAFLRRCLYCDLPFPEDGHLTKILVARFGADAQGSFYINALTLFRKYREKIAGKKPSIAELLDWVAVLREQRVTDTDLRAAVDEGKDAKNLTNLHIILAKSKSDQEALDAVYTGKK